MMKMMMMLYNTRVHSIDTLSAGLYTQYGAKPHQMLCEK